MTDRQKGAPNVMKGVWGFGLIGLIIPACMLLFVGCGPSKKDTVKASKIDKVVKTPEEKKKAGLQKTIDHKFENPEAHYELGQIYQNDGLWTQAEYHYNITLSFDPAHRPAQAAMVKVLIDSGNVNKAKLSADIYMNQVCASAEESLRLALAFQKEGLDDYAVSCYRQALQLAPNSSKINRQIGYYYLSKNDKVQAQEYLTRSFQLNPNQPEVAGELGRLGVVVRIPRKTETNVGKLDKMVDKSNKK